MNIKELIGETTSYDKKVMLEERRPKSWCKSVSAFANYSGGCLIFGINNDDEVIGLENPQEVSEKISEIITSKMDPIPVFDMNFYTVEGKVVVVLKIEEGNIPPYYYVDGGNRTAYRRVGNESIPVDGNALRALILKGANSSFDIRGSRFDKDKFSFSKLKATYFNKTGNVFDEDDYESWSLVENDKLTNAGALLVDESPIRHSRLFCTRWNGLDKASGVIDALDDREFTGSLISLLQNGLEFVFNNSKKQWKKVSDSRIEMPDYPERSVQEGLVNALIHRDYLEIGSEVHIDMYDNRLEIYSPGGMYDGSLVQERDVLRVPSKRRNPIIADAFNRLRLMERRGSGFKKICSDYNSQVNYTEAMAPQFYSDFDSFVLTLWNLNYSEKTQETSEKTQETSEKTQETGEKTQETGEKTQETGEKTQETRGKDIRNKIIEFCSVPRSRVEIAEHIEYKSKSTLWRIYLKPLIVEGKLQMTIPEQPKNRNQKYIVVK